jgi:hypothetical protein
MPVWLKHFFILGMLVCAQPAQALIRMDTESITMALKYGMANQNKGLAGVLGSNWMEGPDGALLNIYTPFMLLATKVSKAGYPTEPTEEDLNRARKEFRRDVVGLTDAQEKQRVKFALSFFGDDETFAVNTTARLEGVAEGRTIVLKPVRELRQPSLTVKPSQLYTGKYEAINSYYFLLEDLMKFESFDIVFTPKTGEPIRFHVSNQQIY